MYLIENPVGALRVAINRCPRCPSPIEEILIVRLGGAAGAFFPAGGEWELLTANLIPPPPPPQ